MHDTPFGGNVQLGFFRPQSGSHAELQRGFDFVLGPVATAETQDKQGWTCQCFVRRADRIIGFVDLSPTRRGNTKTKARIARSISVQKRWTPHLTVMGVFHSMTA